jgi:predicted nucleotidyltransferase
MRKSEKYAKRGALIFAIGNSVLNYCEQIKKMNEDSSRQFDLWEFLKAAGKGAAVGGVGGFAVGYYLDKKNSEIEPVKTDPILKDIVRKVQLNKNNPTYKKLAYQAHIICKKISKEYESELKVKPQFFGSSVKGTALTENFDIDICLQFRADSFSSVRDMFDSLTDFVESLVDSDLIIKARTQKKSIGLFL